MDELGKRAKGVAVQPPQLAPSRPEGWLVDRLVHTAGLNRGDVLAMTSEQAVDAWTAYTSLSSDDQLEPMPPGGASCAGT